MSWNEHGCWVKPPNATWKGRGQDFAEIEIAYNYGGEPYDTNEKDENGEWVNAPAIRGWRFGVHAWRECGGFGWCANLSTKPFETPDEAARQAVAEIRHRIGDDVADDLARQLRISEPMQTDLFGGL